MELPELLRQLGQPPPSNDESDIISAMKKMKEKIQRKKNEASLRINEGLAVLHAMRLEAFQLQQAVFLSSELETAARDLAEAEQKIQSTTVELEQRVTAFRDVEALEKALALLQTSL